MWKILSNLSRIKLTIISDTHMRHNELGTLKGDVLIHCGDMFDLFENRPDDIENVDAWFGRQDFDIILCIGGNHDRALEDRGDKTTPFFKNAIYLEDEAYLYKGLTFYGTPWVPFLKGHAFYADSMMLQEKWSKIPVETDVLITHTPPAGIFDRSSRGQNLGCPNLANRVAEIAPNIHCYGHVHAAGGMSKKFRTTYIEECRKNLGQHI